MISQIGLIVSMTGLTILLYVVARWFYLRVKIPLLIPLITSTFGVIIVLFILQIDYEVYQKGAGWLEHLIGLAVVALAYPLYKQIHILKTYALPLILGTAVGSVVGVVSAFTLAQVVGFDEEVMISLLPKSVTTAVAVDLSVTAGGESSLTAILVTVAGVTGTILYPFYDKVFRLTHPVGRAVGVGSASHAIGTARALEQGELEGAISTVAMTLCAIMVSVLIPIILWFFYN